MHYSEYFFKKRDIINQEIFNKKINWFLDIKSIFHHKTKRKEVIKFAIQISKNYQKVSRLLYMDPYYYWGDDLRNIHIHCV